MQYRQLGRSALKVSALCLGTMNFGPRTSQAESFNIIDDALEVGINFIDTANQYGGELGVGATETIIGNWINANRGRRDQIVLATKVYEPMGTGPNDRGLSARHIQMACEASLKRLRVDHIDLYQMHHIDRSARPEEIWQAMEGLISQGKITYVGSSNFPGWKIAQMNEQAQARRHMGLVCEQALYNLLERRSELEVLPACREYGLGLLTWSPLAGGLLASSGLEQTGRRQSEPLKAAAMARAESLARFGAFCQSLGQTPAAVSLAWLLHQDGIAATIIGPASRAQLASVVSVTDLKLGEDALAALDSIFPPSGPAPEAYAW